MNSVRVKRPDAALAADMATIFNTDGAIDVYVEPDASSSLPYSQNIGFTSCGSVANCTTMTVLRAANFSVGFPERQPYFHYAVYADRRVDESASPPTTTTCSSGVAGVLDTNVIVSVGTTCFGAVSAGQQRGTTMHELGHNLNLVHNRNDDPSQNYSVVHASVMNYRYQFPGVPGRAGALVHSYSFGANACADCNTSPKQTCALVRIAAPGQCAALSPNCDCDVNEWGTWLSTDFVNGARNPNPGAGPNGASPQASINVDSRTFAKGKNGEEIVTSLPAAAQNATPPSASAPAKGLLEDFSPSEFAPIRSAISRNLSGGKESSVKASGPDVWQGPVPNIVSSRRSQLVTRQVEDLKARGLEQSKDFAVTADGNGIVQNCL